MEFHGGRMGDGVPRRRRPLLTAFLVVAAVAAGCGPQVPELHPPQAVPAHSDVWSDEPLRVHLLDGRLFVLDSWSVDPDGEHIRGRGRAYDADRALVESGPLVVALAEVAVLETRERRIPVAGIAVMGVATGASLVGTGLCLANPKACFGSCPTFYVDGPDGRPVVQAEGFSAAIARILETRDLDPLPDAVVRDGTVTIEMRNEALETHAIRSLELLRAEGPSGSRVVDGGGDGFLALGPETAPVACDGPDGCVALLAARDGREAQWDADPADLAAHATMTIEFPAPGSTDVAVSLTVRNTLMSTFLIYHLLALFGTDAGEFYARIERAEPHALLGLVAFGRLLGEIEVSVGRADGSWIAVGEVPFTGPIARDEVALRFAVDDPAAPLHLRLELTRAHWRIDRATAAPVVAEAVATTFAPDSVERDGRVDDGARTALRGEGPRLITWPGDAYSVRFAVSDDDGGGSVAWFLRSRGYYYEWIREEWLADQDPEAAERYLRDPAAALRELARQWVEMAPSADAIFEASRFSGRLP